MTVETLLLTALSLMAAIIGGWARFGANRAIGSMDDMGKRQDGLADRLHLIELQIAKELPTKEDFVDLRREVKSVSVTMHEVRDMVIRMEERNKSSG